MHAVQAADVEPAATAPYVPEAHAVQAEVPVASALNTPAVHAVHREVPMVSALYAPAVHAVQAADEAAAVALP